MNRLLILSASHTNSCWSEVVKITEMGLVSVLWDWHWDGLWPENSALQSYAILQSVSWGCALKYLIFKSDCYRVSTLLTGIYQSCIFSYKCYYFLIRSLKGTLIFSWKTTALKPCVLLFGCGSYSVLKAPRDLESACTLNNNDIIELLVNYIISFSCSHVHTLNNVKKIPFTGC